MLYLHGMQTPDIDAWAERLEGGPNDVRGLIRDIESLLETHPQDAEWFRFAWMKLDALSVLGDTFGAGDYHSGLFPAVEAWYGKAPNDLEHVRPYITWLRQASRFVMADGGFAAYPAYRRMLELLQPFPRDLVIARLDLLREYLFWLESGGDRDLMEREEVAMLDEMADGIQAEVETVLAGLDRPQDRNAVLQRLMMFLQMNQHLQEALDVCVQIMQNLSTEDAGYLADKAVLLMESGQMKALLGNKEGALADLHQAQEAFRSLGPDFEQDLIQAEGLMTHIATGV